RSLFTHYLIVTTTTELYTLSLHDALPICCLARPPPAAGASRRAPGAGAGTLPRASGPTAARRTRGSRRTAPPAPAGRPCRRCVRSEEHTSELQSRENLVCRLLLEKKKKC